MSRVVNAATSKPFGPFASTTQFVRNQYRDVLGRAPTFGEIYYGIQYVGHSSTRSAALIASLMQSRRARAERPVRAAALPRVGSAQLPGARRATDQRRDRLRLGLSSPAGAGAGGGRADGRGVGRRRRSSTSSTSGRSAGPPTPRAAPYWLRRLDGGCTRAATVLMALTESPEARWERAAEVVVAATVLSMLGRAAHRRRPGPLDRAARVGHLAPVLIDDLFRRSGCADPVSVEGLLRSGGSAAQASITTGTIIGRRLVRSLTKRPAARRTTFWSDSMSLVDSPAHASLSAWAPRGGTRPAGPRPRRRAPSPG